MEGRQSVCAAHTAVRSSHTGVQSTPTGNMYGGDLDFENGYGDGPQDGGEAIYNWIKQEVPVPAKPARYRSKHNPRAPVSGSTLRVNKSAAGTFGRPSQVPNPRSFLKAGSKVGKGTTTIGRRTFASVVSCEGCVANPVMRTFLLLAGVAAGSLLRACAGVAFVSCGATPTPCDACG